MENCIFCKIIKGEIPSYTVYEDDYFKAILDIAPSSSGHTIMIAKCHAENLLELPDEFCENALKIAKKLGGAIMKGTKADGFNILQNNGAAAWQSVSHFHIHIIPRSNDDGVLLPSKTLSPSKEEFEAVLVEIKKEIEK